MDKNIHDKASAFKTSQLIKELGIYPYFRAIESEQDTEVLINGKKL